MQRRFFGIIYESYMKTDFQIAVFGVLSVVCALTAHAEKQAFDRYQSIIDRLMFGPLPDDFDPTKLPSEVSRSSSSAAARKGEVELTKEEQKLKSAVHFSVINVTPDGSVAVGFTDNSDKKLPCHYYLKVGEERNGWVVKAADAETATMTIAKGEIEITLSIGGDSSKDAGATSKAGAGKPGPVVGGRQQSGLMAFKKPKQKRTELMAENERLRAERAEERRQEEERRALEKEEREANNEAVRRSLDELRRQLSEQREQNKKTADGDEGNGENENNDAE
jgi:hypothetical protein